MDPTTYRLFLGIPLPEALQEQLDTFQAIQPSNLGIRWTPRINRHITVYFFGGIPPEMMDNLKALLNLGLRNARPFELAFDRFCLAPKASRPRMIWARYQKQDVFKYLAQEIHQLFLQVQPKQQVRHDPTPHITLARLQEPESSQGLIWKNLPQINPLSVSQLVLWESTLALKGAPYEPLAHWDLSAR